MFWRHVELVSISHFAEYKPLYVTLNQVQGDVSDIMTHYGHPISFLLEFFFEKDNFANVLKDRNT